MKRTLTSLLTSTILALTNCSSPSQIIPPQDFFDSLETFHQNMIKDTTHYNPLNGHVIIRQCSEPSDPPFNPLTTWEKILGYSLSFQGTIDRSFTIYHGQIMSCNEYQGIFYKQNTTKNITTDIIAQSSGGPLDCPTYLNALNQE